jgi:hypothetical protein
MKGWTCESTACDDSAHSHVREPFSFATNPVHTLIALALRLLQYLADGPASSVVRHCLIGEYPFLCRAKWVLNAMVCQQTLAPVPDGHHRLGISRPRRYLPVNSGSLERSDPQALALASRK